MDLWYNHRKKEVSPLQAPKLHRSRRVSPQIVNSSMQPYQLSHPEEIITKLRSDKGNLMRQRRRQIIIKKHQIKSVSNNKKVLNNRLPKLKIKTPENQRTTTTIIMPTWFHRLSRKWRINCQTSTTKTERVLSRSNPGTASSRRSSYLSSIPTRRRL
jgi:hypothetical protein